MRTLSYSIDLDHFNDIKKEIVPILFTEHQFNLIIKRFTNKQLTLSEKNEFSRTISRKMKAINKIAKKEDIITYGDIIRERKGKKIIKELSRRFKNKHILLTGSFLYKKHYNDIDIFVISKYDKENYKEGDYHINYITSNSGLFFQSISKICISNRRINSKLTEKPNLDKYISLFQELSNDIISRRKDLKWMLKEFLLYSDFISGSGILGSKELTKKYVVITNKRNLFRIVRNIFVSSVSLGITSNILKKDMKKMKRLYENSAKDNKQHQDYYLNMADAFNEVISSGT